MNLSVRLSVTLRYCVRTPIVVEILSPPDISIITVSSELIAVNSFRRLQANVDVLLLMRDASSKFTAQLATRLENSGPLFHNDHNRLW